MAEPNWCADCDGHSGRLLGCTRCGEQVMRVWRSGGEAATLLDLFFEPGYSFRKTIILR